MDPLGAFALTTFFIAATQHAAATQYYQYAAQAQAACPCPVAAAPGWVAPPLPYYYAAPSEPARPAQGNPAATREFVQHWQGFMEPAVSRSGSPTPLFHSSQR